MKDKFLRLTKWILSLTIAVSLLISFNIGVSASEEEIISVEDTGGEISENLPEINGENGEATDNLPKNEGESGEMTVNVFEEIYGVMEENADKIFSVLAFVGTLVVGVGYRSGLLPLLRDALSKLKLAIDNIKADGEKNKALTESKMGEISSAIENINSAIESNNGQLKRIQWQFENYEELMAERDSMRTILKGQIDMLYAIFMSSALPQYQKDEIGNKIQEMREELASYENPDE